MRGSLALLFGLAQVAVAAAAPPVVTVPQEVAGEPAAFVVVKATTTGKWVKYVPLDGGLSVFPSDLLADKTVTVVVASKPGRYRVLAYSGNDDGGAEAVTTVVIGGGVTPITPDPPKDPPVIPAKRLHFMLVYPSDVGVPVDVQKSRDLPVWADIEKAGHSVGVLSYFALKPDAQAKLSGKPLPLVAVWEHTAEGKIRLTDVTKPLPTPDTTVKELLK